MADDTLETLQQELDQALSDNTRLTIEHESTLQSLHTQISSLTTSLDSTAAQISAITSERDAERAENVKLRGEIEGLKKGAGEGREKDVEWEKKVEVVEREKRGLLSVVEELETSKGELQSDLTATKEQLSSVSSSLRSTESALTAQSESERSIRLRLQTVELNLELTQSSRQFFEEELSKGKSEWSKQRAESHHEIVRLSAALETANTSLESTTTTFQSLKSAHASLQTTHTDSLARIQELTTSLATSEASFRNEIASQKRLVELMESREKEREKRMEEVENEWSERRREVEAMEENARSQIELERRRADELEHKYEEAKDLVERLSSGDDVIPFIRNALPPGSVGSNGRSAAPFTPGTPLNRLSNAGGATGLMLSPAAALASKMQKGGMSVTEIYGRMVQAQEELVGQRAESRRLNECLQQILAEIEDRAPLLKEQRAEYDRLRFECDALTTQLTSALSDRSTFQRHSESHRVDAESAHRDLSIATQQLHDLGRQVRSLTREIAKRDDPSIVERSNGDDGEDGVDGMDVSVDLESTEEILQAHLVTFTSITQLQLKNQSLLQIARGLAKQVEENHEGREMDESRVVNDAVEEAHGLILGLKDELESEKVRAEALSRERDMYRRMMGQATSTGSGDGPGNEVGFHTGGRSNGGGGGGGGVRAEAAETVRQLVEIQAQFEAYKVEIGVDRERIREETTGLRSQLSQVEVRLAKANAQLEYSNERNKMLNQTQEMEAEQAATISKRVVKLQEEISRGDTLLHQANERITEWQGNYNILKHNHDTLVTEKEVWRGVEARLQADNASLARERDGINNVLAQLQSLQGELERTSHDARRRLESQVARLEVQLSDTKDRLKVESGNAKQASLQREVEGREYQSRLDKLNTEHSAARETLSAAQTAQIHLETRVSDLLRQIAAKEEKLAVYEGRSRGTAGTSADPSLTKEQQLEMQLAELRAELGGAQDEAARLRGHVEQYKSIAETAEQALASLTSTHDEYKASQESVYASKEAELVSLQEHLHKVTEDLTTATSDNDDLRRQLESQRSEFEQAKASLETHMSEVQTIEQRAKETEAALNYQIALHSAREKANHEKYLAEVKNHGETVDEMKTVKNSLEGLRKKLHTSTAELKAIRNNLATSEASWEERRTSMQKEVEEVQQRCTDLVAQNNLLHEHLQTVSSQAANIEKAAAAGGEGEASTADPGYDGDSLDQLRGVVRYLRNNTEIAQRQVEVTKLECARFQQQLEHTSRSLDQARAELTQERTRANSNSSLAGDHAHLLEQVNSLNILRESNATLREEFLKAERRSKKLEESLRASQQRVHPLESQVRDLDATVQQLRQEITMLSEDNERWKLRNQQILEKYDRVDPAEVQGLRDEVTALSTQLAAARTTEAAHATQLSEQAAAAQSRFQALQTQTRALRDRLHGEINGLKEQLAKAEAEAASAKAAVTAAEAAQVNDRSQVEAAAAAQATSSTELSGLRQQKSQLETTVAGLQTEQARLLGLVADLDRIKGESEAAKTELKTAQAELEFNKSEVEKLANKDALMKRDTKIFRDRAIAAEARVTELEKNLADGVKDQPVTPAAALSQEEIDKRVKDKVEETAAQTVTDRQAAIEAAVAETTAALRAEFEKAQAAAVDAAKADAKAEALSTAAESAPPSGPSEEEINTRIAAKVAEAEKALQSSAETAALQAAEKHKAELVEAVSKAESSAIAAAAASKPTLEDGQVDPGVDLQTAVAKAVEDAVAKKEAETKAVVDAAVEAATDKIKNELNRKLVLQRTQLQKAQRDLTEARTKSQTAESPAPASATASTPDPVPLASASSTPTAPSARGAGRGIRGASAGRGGVGRGGGAIGRGTGLKLPVDGAMAGPKAPPSGISIRGKASGAAGALLRGAMGGAGAATGLTGKRLREEEAAGTSDASKRAKGGAGTNVVTRAQSNQQQG